MLQELLALAGVCKVLTETVLGGIRARLTVTDADGTTHLSIPDATFSWIALVVSLIVAVLANEVAGLNILAGTAVATRVSPDVAILFTGLAIGFGSNIVNELFDVLQGWAASARTPTSSATATVTTSGPTSGLSSGGATASASATAPTTPVLPSEPTL